MVHKQNENKFSVEFSLFTKVHTQEWETLKVFVIRENPKEIRVS